MNPRPQEPHSAAPDALDAYAHGLEAECSLLDGLLHLSSAQHAVCRAGDYQAMAEAAAEREGLAARLNAIEARLGPIRTSVAATREHLGDDPRFARVSARHRAAADLVARILEQDRATVALLEGQAARRREVSQQLETGEATLAAYRRAITARPPHAGLLNRRG